MSSGWAWFPPATSQSIGATNGVAPATRTVAILAHSHEIVNHATRRRRIPFSLLVKMTPLKMSLIYSTAQCVELVWYAPPCHLKMGGRPIVLAVMSPVDLRTPNTVGLLPLKLMRWPILPPRSRSGREDQTAPPLKLTSFSCVVARRGAWITPLKKQGFDRRAPIHYTESKYRGRAYRARRDFHFVSLCPRRSVVKWCPAETPGDSESPGVFRGSL